MVRIGIARGLAAFSLLLVAACAQDESQPAPAATTTVTATVTATPTAGPPAAAEIAFPPKPPSDAKTVALRDFVMPSGNIICTDEFEGLSCYVNEASFPTQEQPDDCDVDWAANEIDFLPPLTTLGACRGDPPPAILNLDAPTFKYGTVNKLKDGVLCFSETKGLSCWAPDSGHGFFVSKSAFATF